MKSKRKRKLAALLLALALITASVPFTAMAGEAADLEWYNFRNNPENNGVVDKTTPISAETAGLKWAEKYGTGRWDNPTPPLILDGYLYVGLKNKVYKIDKTTGEKVAESDEMVAGVGFAMNPVTYADGKLFVQVGNGMIQAIDYETLKCVWSTEKIGGQTVSPISYAQVDGKGYLYSGTWNSFSGDGAVMCVSTDDSNVNEDKIKKTEWRFMPSGDETSLKNIVYEGTPLTYDEDVKEAIADGSANKRGFYWAGAYACGKFIAVGSDDGADDYGEPQKSACFYTIDSKTGEIIDKISGIEGDIRTSAVYDDGFLYFCSKGGGLCKVAVDENGNLGEAVTAEMGGEVTSSPVVYNGRIYIGVKGQGEQFDPDGGHAFAVVDADSMTKLYDLPISGYPQASALLSTAYENEDFDGDGKADGRVYLYFTYNARPGGIYYTYDAKNRENAAAECGELFIPSEDKQNYCISTICADNDGVLYYKNDSGYLMAVRNMVAYASGISIPGALSWSSEFTPANTEYEVVMAAGTKSANIKLELPYGVSAEVNGEACDDSTGTDIILDENGRASVKVTTAFNSEDIEDKNSDADVKDSTEYTINIRCIGTESSLNSLKVSGSNIFGEDEYSIEPAFSKEKTEYTVDVRGKDKSFYNVWPELADDNGTIKVYAEENVKPDEVSGDGSIELASSIEGNDRYAVYPDDKSKNVKVRIEVTSENGEEVTNYNVTMVKEEQKITEEVKPSKPDINENDGNGTDDSGTSSGVSKTGDSSNVFMWLALIVFAAATGIAAAFKRKRE